MLKICLIRSMAKLFLLLLISSLAPSSTLLASEPTKSLLDDRIYKAIKLQNGLKVILVSDNKAEKAAAALTVNVGSNNEDKSRQGLAHFLVFSYKF